MDTEFLDKSRNDLWSKYREISNFKNKIKYSDENYSYHMCLDRCLIHMSKAIDKLSSAHDLSVKKRVKV